MSKGDDWRECILEEVAEIIVSNVDKKTIMGETPVRLCNYMDVYSNEYISKPLDFMEATATLIEIKRFAIETGDVIITKDSETPDDIGIPSVVTGSFSNLICGYHLALLKPNKKIIDPVFLSKMISSPQIASYYGKIASGSTRFGLSNSGIAKTPLAIPPLPQQRKIAKILTTVDNLIEKTESLIAKYQSIKQGMMHDLFTRGIDAKGKLRPPQSVAPELYKQSELGWIPKEWEVGKIDDFCEIHNHLRFPISSEQREQMQGEYPYYGPTGIFDRLDHYRVDGEYALIGEDGDHFLKFASQSMTILVRGKFNINNHAHLLKGKQGCSTQWVSTFYCHRDIKVHITHQGAGRLKLNKAALRRMPIVVPQSKEQANICKRFLSVNSRIDTEQRHLEKISLLKIALMQDLLTGKVQVTPDEIDKESAQLNAYLKELGYE